MELSLEVPEKTGYGKTARCSALTEPFYPDVVYKFILLNCDDLSHDALSIPYVPQQSDCGHENHAFWHVSDYLVEMFFS
jgi:hypothetical protein